PVPAAIIDHVLRLIIVVSERIRHPRPGRCEIATAGCRKARRVTAKRELLRRRRIRYDASPPLRAVLDRWEITTVGAVVILVGGRRPLRLLRIGSRLRIGLRLAARRVQIHRVRRRVVGIRRVRRGRVVIRIVVIRVVVGPAPIEKRRTDSNTHPPAVVPVAVPTMPATAMPVTAAMPATAGMTTAPIAAAAVPAAATTAMAAATTAMAAAVALSEHARRRAAQCCGQRKCNQSFEHEDPPYPLPWPMEWPFATPRYCDACPSSRRGTVKLRRRASVVAMVDPI